MKTILELCKEEMDAFIASVHPKVDASQLFEAGFDMDALTRNGMAEYQRVMTRVNQDPALRYLADKTIAAILDFEHGMTGKLPPEVMAQTLGLIFSKMIIVWENANQRYDEQLKPAPQA